MKKFLSTILILSIYATMNVLPAYSSVDLHAVTTKQSQIIKLQVDGKEKNYSIKWNNEHNRLLIESDFIVDCFGANVFNSGNNIDITKGNHKLHFEIDNEFYLMDDFGGRKIGCLAEINKDDE